MKLKPKTPFEACHHVDRHARLRVIVTVEAVIGAEEPGDKRQLGTYKGSHDYRTRKSSGKMMIHNTGDCHPSFA
ncbi:MAG TPA: hypothetical protein VGA66_11905 [Mycobacterium sp.]